MIEQWKVIDGFPWYAISDHGRVYSHKTKKILKAGLSPDGYYTVVLDTKYTKAVHRLVALHFVPNPSDLPIAHHLDGIRSNNRASNLGWSTYSDNTKDSFTSGRNKGYKVKVAKMLDGIVIDTYDSLLEAAEKNNQKSTTGIHACCNNTNKTAGGFNWKYVEKEVSNANSILQ